MARLGIVVAVSENRGVYKSLKACEKDGQAFAALLKATNRFDEILVLGTPEETVSREVKARISAFVDRYKSQVIEEVVFYYSGHGELAGDEFFHVLSDFDPALRNQTGLANSELDGIVRALNPVLFAKFVDACYSGTNYIKGGDDLENYLKSSNSGFKDVYFMYSSQSDELSWTEGPVSAFTKSLLLAVGRWDTGAVRYRDLMSAVSDYFEARGGQTPQFVTQAGFTDVFCESSPQLQSVVAVFLPALASSPAPPATSTPVPAAPAKSMSLVGRVKAMEQSYRTREQATEILKKFQERIAVANLNGELNELYTLTVTASDEEAEGATAIGDWLEKQTRQEFFAAPRFRTEVFKKRILRQRPSFLGFSQSLTRQLQGPESELIDATRLVIDGYRNTATLPFNTVNLRLDPKYTALAPEECVIAVVVSRSSARFFWSLRHYHYSDWDTAVRDPAAPRWSAEGIPFADESSFTTVGSRIVQDLVAFTKRRLADWWPTPEAAPPSLPASAKPTK